MVQTLAKAKSFAQTGSSNGCQASPPASKRDPDYFTLGNVCPQLFSFRGRVGRVAGLHFSIEYSSRLCFRHDLIVPHRKLSALGMELDLGSHDATGPWLDGVYKNIYCMYIFILTNDFRCMVGTA